jgi:hypothetical protein
VLEPVAVPVPTGTHLSVPVADVPVSLAVPVPDVAVLPVEPAVPPAVLEPEVPVADGAPVDVSGTMPGGQAVADVLPAVPVPLVAVPLGVVPVASMPVPPALRVAAPPPGPPVSLVLVPACASTSAGTAHNVHSIRLIMSASRT